VSTKSTTTKRSPPVPNPNTSEYSWTGHSRIADTLSHFVKSWHHASHLRRRDGSDWGCGATTSWQRVLRSCLVPHCSHPPHWPRHQRRLDAFVLRQRTTFLFSQDSTCWASLQRSHFVSSTLRHGAWTPAPLSAHLSSEWEWMASQIDSLHNSSSVQLTTISEVWRSGQITDGMRSGWTTLRDSVLSSPKPTLLEWPFQ